MATKVCCDRCKSEIDSCNEGSLKLNMKFFANDKSEGGESFFKTWDICPSCRKKLGPVLGCLMNDFVINAPKSSFITKDNFIKLLSANRNVNLEYLTWAQSQVSARDIIEKCPEGQYLICLIAAIGGPLLAEYNKKECLLWAEYHDKRAPFMDKRRGKEAQLLAGYWGVTPISPLWVEYKKKRDVLWAEYENQRDLFWVDCREKRHNLAKGICTFERVVLELAKN